MGTEFTYKNDIKRGKMMSEETDLETDDENSLVLKVFRIRASPDELSYVTQQRYKLDNSSKYLYSSDALDTIFDVVMKKYGGFSIDRLYKMYF